MSIFRRGRINSYGFVFRETRFQESAHQTNNRVAMGMELAHRTWPAQGEVELRCSAFSVLVARVSCGLDSPRKWAEWRTTTIYVYCSRHLNLVRSAGWQQRGGEAAMATSRRKAEAPNRREVNVRVGT
jgi:hypothetical protein